MLPAVKIFELLVMSFPFVRTSGETTVRRLGDAPF